ncbi:MAG: hypothetical protein DRJ37_03495, partial [Thermoprotei archaeon]
PPTEAYEYLIPSYWSWSVEAAEKPVAPRTVEPIKLIQAALPWFLLILVAFLLVDRFRLRKMIEEQSYPIVRKLPPLNSSLYRKTACHLPFLPLVSPMIS